jgi:uncharacterized protein (DUF1800 family)
VIDKMPDTTAALIAATRLGFGPHAGELRTIAQDPRGWALAQLAHPLPALSAALPMSTTMVMAELEMRRDQRAHPDEEAKRQFNERVRAVYLAEITARTAAAAAGDTPLLERLCHFWSNHFTVSIQRPAVRGFAAAFEREAIRPHVTGRFADMLLAATRHPAMLLYLDNAVSIGPDSPVGMRRDKGINENLGRELLELHTLGVDGGYTQDDVVALARILTGWSVARLNEPGAGGFIFRPMVHEPGTKMLLGRSFADNGYAEGEAALLMLAAHRATAHHIALKLARHFIADEPPRDSVERIARVFHDSGGDLRQVTAAVLREDALWRKPFAKLRTPGEMVIAACRVTGFTPPPQMLAASLRQLDQLPFAAPSPAGWPDTAADWLSPEAVLRRADWCQSFASHLPEPPDPVELAAASYGEALPEETLVAIRRAPARRLGVALLLASPQFQRR